MNDNDLRALAAKLLKHYVADQNPVAEALVAQIPLDRKPAQIIPLITAEQRALLDMLGGSWAGVHEAKSVALIAQGCGGCSGCGDDDDGGSTSSESSSTASDAADATAGPADTGAPDGGAPDAGAGAPDVGGPDTGAPDGGAPDAGFGAPDVGGPTTEGLGGLTADNVGGWGSLGEGLGGPGGLGGLAGGLGTGGLGTDAEATGMQGLSGISVDNLSNLSQATLDALANTQDPGISAASYGALANQNAEADATLNAVNAGLDATAADQGGGALSSIGSALGELFGVGSAKAGEFSPQNSGIAAVQDAAIAAAKAGQLDSFLANNFTAAAVLSTNPANLSDLQAQNSAALSAQAASPTGGATLGSWAGSKAAERDAAQAQSTFDLAAPAAPADPYGSLTMSPEQAKAAELSGQIAAIGANPATATGFTAAPAAPSAPSQVAAAPALAAESPTTSLTIGRDTQPTAMSSTTAAAPTYTGIDAIDSRINNAIANPGQTAINMGVGLVPGLGLANTVSGLFGGPTAGGLISGAYNSGAISGGQPSETGDTGSGSNNEYIPPSDLTTTGTAGLSTAPAAAAAPATQPAQQTAIDAAVRRYLGLPSDPYSYGSGAERQFYAADGGQFNAEQYFADGGIVQPLSPPTTPLVSAQPTMAFTDGAGAIGSIAQPPGLAPSDAYGFDASTASPMAPSVAAAVPSLQPGLSTLATPNVNASPTPSPIAQNPNVGYALGNSPLSNLTRP